MFENVKERTANKSSFRESLSALPARFDAMLPSMDKSLDRYFDSHMSMIISEWGLLSTHHLDNLEHRLTAISTEIRQLERGRDEITKRAAALDAALREQEGR